MTVARGEVRPPRPVFRGYLDDSHFRGRARAVHIATGERDHREEPRGRDQPARLGDPDGRQLPVPVAQVPRRPRDRRRGGVVEAGRGVTRFKPGDRAAMMRRARRQGIRAKFVNGATLRANEVSKAVYEDYLPAALASGEYQAAPGPRVIGRGVRQSRPRSTRRCQASRPRRSSSPWTPAASSWRESPRIVRENQNHYPERARSGSKAPATCARITQPGIPHYANGCEGGGRPGISRSSGRKN